MTTSQQVAKSLPYLRRYARALTGSPTSGDNFVKATLEAIIAEPEMLEADPRPRVALYKAFQRIYDSVHIEVDGDGEGDNLERAAQRWLRTIAPDRKRPRLNYRTYGAYRMLHSARTKSNHISIYYQP